ncbi:MAG: peptidyl-prolyl cis-trans isomerase [Deltaproteobacteria bacterium]|nr:peptidyl-prolyl cis-trans isomerase [Deltaproteobacteria bacterium]
MIARAARTAAAALVLSACASPTDQGAPAVQQAALGGGVAARIGDDVIPVSLVVAVARAQKITKEEALRRVVDDAVAAQAAKKRGLDREPPTSWSLTAARARFTVDRMVSEARAKGPPTAEEITKLSNDHWQEVDRPVAVRTVHAVVRADPDAPPETKKVARGLAESIREAVLAATSADDFIAKANAVPRPKDAKIIVENLPPATEDGWVTEGDNTQAMNRDFAKAANALAKPGDTSPIVETRFGYHVIRLVERIPEQRMPMEVRRVAFAEDAYGLRGGASRQATLAEWKAKNPASVEPAAESLMRSVTGSLAAPSAP